MNANQTVNLKVGVKSAPPTPPVETVNAGSVSLESTRIGRQTPPPKTQAPWTGEFLGEYEIGDLIGEGGNGQVYRARHRCLDVPVALKILHSVDPDDDATVNRFRQEAMASAKLVHPNLVRATDAGILERHLFLVTDLVDGVDLHELIQKEKHLSCENVCELGRMACEGLLFLAADNTVHRDIKPSNIMVDKSGQVRILDLGLARSGDQSNTLTVDGQIMGTVDFMSPEQALNPREVDFHADMYSLGCTLYFLLSGKAPFEDEHQTVAAKLLAHMGVPPAPISLFRKDIPNEVARIVMAMLEKDVAKRPESFYEVIDVLSKYSAGHNLAEVVGGEGHATVGHATDRRAAIARTNVQFASRSLRQKQKPKDPVGNVWFLSVAGVVMALALSWWFVNCRSRFFPPENLGPDLCQQPIVMEFHDPSNENMKSAPVVETQTVSRPTATTTYKNRKLEDWRKYLNHPVQPPSPSKEEPRYTAPKRLLPPPGLTEKGLADWQKYLERDSHKAWVHDRKTGNYGYATQRATVEEAIRVAKEYGENNGDGCELYSVDGKPQP